MEKTQTNKKQFNNSDPCPLPVVSALMWRDTSTEATVSMQFWKYLSFFLCFEEDQESLLLCAKQK